MFNNLPINMELRVLQSRLERFWILFNSHADKEYYKLRLDESVKEIISYGKNVSELKT